MIRVASVLLFGLRFHVVRQLILNIKQQTYLMFLYKEANDMRTDIERGSTRSHKYIKQQPGHERGATIAYETNRICDLRFRGLERLFSKKR